MIILIFQIFCFYFQDIITIPFFLGHDKNIDVLKIFLFFEYLRLEAIDFHSIL